MKPLSSLIAVATIAFLHLSVSAQSTIVSDDFESYTAGKLLAANSDLWTTWSGGIDAEDAPVSNAQASSGSNSVHVVGSNGPVDLVLPFPEDYTSGTYELSLKMYVVAGNGAYFNIQQSSVPGVGWMFEMYFDDAGGGFIHAGGLNAATFSYTPDSWTDIKVKVDLTNDYAELFVNSGFIHSWQWSLASSGFGSVKQMGGVDIFAAAANGGHADFYVDDIQLTQETCPLPANLTVSNITATSAKLKWDEVAGAEGYKVRYKVSGTNQWTVANTTGTHKNLNNLSPNTSYTWEVKTFCTIAPGLSSDWSAKQHFTTEPLRMGDGSVQQVSFQVYPNPAEDHATIQFTLAQSSHVSIKVYDLSGKEVETLLDDDTEQGDHLLQINTDHFSKGVYMVRMISDSGIENQKLIVQ